VTGGKPNSFPAVTSWGKHPPSLRSYGGQADAIPNSEVKPHTSTPRQALLDKLPSTSSGQAAPMVLLRRESKTLPFDPRQARGSGLARIDLYENPLRKRGGFLFCEWCEKIGRWFSPEGRRDMIAGVLKASTETSCTDRMT
jgi:hypothetical protein